MRILQASRSCGAATALLGCLLAASANAQALDPSVNASVDSSADKSVMNSVKADAGGSSQVNAGTGSGMKGTATPSKASSRKGSIGAAQDSLGFQVSALDSGKLQYFGYTLNGSSEMSSAGELTVSFREKSIAARENALRNPGSGPAPKPASSQLRIAVARTRMSESKLASLTGQPDQTSDPGGNQQQAAGHAVLAIVVSPENGPAMLKIPLVKRDGSTMLWSKRYLADSPFAGPKPMTSISRNWTSGFADTQHTFSLNHGKRVHSVPKASPPKTPQPVKAESANKGNPFSNFDLKSLTTVR